jgi:serine/threonine protein kinase
MEPQVGVGHFVFGKLLGSGTSGKVFQGIHPATGFVVAIKMICNENPETWAKQERLIRREIAIMKLLEHDNILKLYDVYETQNRIYMVMEFAGGGELFDHIVKLGKLPRAKALGFLAQLCSALLHCQHQAIAHRDLKPENILLDADKTRVKIADFGLSALWGGCFGALGLQTDLRSLHTRCGSPHYASPEVIDGKYDGRTSDVWSLGVILFVMIVGSLPFNHENIPKLLRIIKSGVFSIPAEVDDQCADLIRRMLTVDPTHRITLTEMQFHPALIKVPFPLSNIPSWIEYSRGGDPLRVLESSLVREMSCLGLGHKTALRAKLSDAAGGIPEKALYNLLLMRKTRRAEELSAQLGISIVRTVPPTELAGDPSPTEFKPQALVSSPFALLPRRLSVREPSAAAMAAAAALAAAAAASIVSPTAPSAPLPPLSTPIPRRRLSISGSSSSRSPLILSSRRLSVGPSPIPARRSLSRTPSRSPSLASGGDFSRSILSSGSSSSGSAFSSPIQQTRRTSFAALSMGGGLVFKAPVLKRTTSGPISPATTVRRVKEVVPIVRRVKRSKSLLSKPRTKLGGLESCYDEKTLTGYPMGMPAPTPPYSPLVPSWSQNYDLTEDVEMLPLPAPRYKSHAMALMGMTPPDDVSMMPMVLSSGGSGSSPSVAAAAAAAAAAVSAPLSSPSAAGSAVGAASAPIPIAGAARPVASPMPSPIPVRGRRLMVGAPGESPFDSEYRGPLAM